MIRYIYLASFLLITIISKAQMITSVAGIGASSYVGDGGPASAAALLPADVVFDRQGNMFVADVKNRIRKINPSGIITTIAGDGTSGSTGDGGAASAAKVSSPQSITVDSAGNLYFSEIVVNKIRKISATGIISAYVGTGTAGYSPDGTIATAAQITNTEALALDKSGNLYFTDDNYLVRKVNVLTGTISTVAGTTTLGFSGDGGPATNAQVYGPHGLAFDDTGNLYIGDFENNRVRKISTLGIITTITGSTYGYSGDGGTATAAKLRKPSGLVYDDLQGIYIADYYGSTVRRISLTDTISTITGSDLTGSYSGDGGSASAALLFGPTGIKFDACGNFFIADNKNYRIRKISYPPNTQISISNTPSFATIGSSVTVTCSLYHAGYSPTIKWYNKGILFATTTSLTATYTKTMCVDSIIAVVYGCSDSATSAVKVVRCNVGIESFQSSANNLRLYPNPVLSEVTVVSELAMESISITDVLGKLFTFRKCVGETQMTIPLGSLPKGIYFVKVNSTLSGCMQAQRFIKE